MSERSPSAVLSEQSAQLALSMGGTIPQRGWIEVPLRSYHSASSDGSITIPADFESEECLIFLGLKKAAAASIMRRYFPAKARFADFGWDWGEMVELAKSYLERGEDAWRPEDDWDAALKKMGMRREARVAMLNPEFNWIRLLGTAQSGAIETVELRWDFLNYLDKKIQQKAKMMEPSAMSTPPDALVVSKILIPPSEVALHTYLFKGGLYSRFSKLVRKDGSLALFTTFSCPPTDFSPNSNEIVYFTKQREVAQQYAEYASERIYGRAETGILCFAVPNDLCTDSYEVMGQEWRDLVWTSRRGDYELLEGCGYLPERLRHISELPLLIGPICGNALQRVKTMSDESELCMLKTRNGEEGTQYVFQTRDMLRSLSQRCRGKISYEAIIPTGPGILEGIEPHTTGVPRRSSLDSAPSSLEDDLLCFQTEV